MDRRLAVAGMMALPMCRRDIGDYLGLTLETISRALSQLHDEGVLGFSGARQIVLHNRQRLRNMDIAVSGIRAAAAVVSHRERQYDMSISCLIHRNDGSVPYHHAFFTDLPTERTNEQAVPSSSIKLLMPMAIGAERRSLISGKYENLTAESLQKSHAN